MRFSKYIFEGGIIAGATCLGRVYGGRPKGYFSNVYRIGEQDWLDIDFAIKEGVDFIAVSFVKNADVINNLKSYVDARADKVIEIIAKVESYDSVPNQAEIVEASDAVMVARGDLGECPFLPEVAYYPHLPPIVPPCQLKIPLRTAIRGLHPFSSHCIRLGHLNSPPTSSHRLPWQVYVKAPFCSSYPCQSHFLSCLSVRRLSAAAFVYTYAAQHQAERSNPRACCMATPVPIQ